MKNAKKMVAEIDRKKRALRNTKSEHLERDYRKSIYSDLKELRDYCKFKGLDFKAVIKL